MERVYYIDHVSSDDINALSLKLNSMQEVSHIKINKDSISFNCEIGRASCRERVSVRV